MNLTCEGLKEGIPYELKAATLSSDGRTLILIVENGSDPTTANRIVCEYGMNALQNALMDTWMECQKNHNAAYIHGVCQQIMLLDSFCQLSTDYSEMREATRQLLPLLVVEERHDLH